MKLALVLTPPDDHHFRLAAQVGATEFVARYPSVDTPQKLREQCERAQSFGLALSVVEGYLPHIGCIHGGPTRDEEMIAWRVLLEAMRDNNVKTLCYNWMPRDDWTRTSFEYKTRGGAQTNGFNIEDLKSAAAQNHTTSADALWRNLEFFLRRVAPIAESCGVVLALHPDDPPLPNLGGAPQIFHSPDAFEKLFNLCDSPANTMCFCQGTFAAMGADIPASIARFGKKIRYVHFRDVRGSAENFVETFHDDGPTDMAAAMRAYFEIGFSGAMRPDHVPQLDGEAGRADGYSMLGRLFAAGYIKGLMDATQSEIANGQRLA